MLLYRPDFGRSEQRSGVPQGDVLIWNEANKVEYYTTNAEINKSSGWMLYDDFEKRRREDARTKKQEGTAMRVILDRLGISTKYKGYRMLASAIEIAVENEEAILLVTKLIYPEVAKRFGVSGSNVDKNIRVAITAFWNNGNRDLYNKIVGYEVAQRPSNAEFIAAIASYIIRSGIASSSPTSVGDR